MVMNGSLMHHEPVEDWMATDTQRLFDKLDAMQSTQATMAADIARTQGSQKSMESHLDTIRTAIGDVNETKLEVRAATAKMESLEKDLQDLKKAAAAAVVRADMKGWAETLVKWAVASLAAGSGIGAGVEIMKRVL